MATPLRALVVEDSEDDCMLLLSILRRGGYACARTTRVFTAAFVFACSLMALPHDPCCDRSTRTLAHGDRRKTQITPKFSCSSDRFREERELQPRNLRRKERNHIFPHFES
jgi:hypothetical protein